MPCNTSSFVAGLHKLYGQDIFQDRRRTRTSLDICSYCTCFMPDSYKYNTKKTIQCDRCIILHVYDFPISYTFIIYVFSDPVSAQAPILSPASEICPGDDLTFTCTVPSAVIEWMYMGMTRPATAGELGGVIDPLGPFQVEVVDRTEGSGSVFTSVTSTITATADTAMDGEMVTCVNAGAGGDNSRSAVVNIIIGK